MKETADPPRGPGLWHVLHGGCMRPLLKDGEVLPIEPCGAERVRPGDIVLYRIGAKRLLHRVRRVDSRGVWLKDDTGTVDLHRVPRRSVLGRLEGRCPLSHGPAGLAFSWINTAVFVAGRAVKSVLRYAF